MASVSVCSLLFNQLPLALYQGPWLGIDAWRLTSWLLLLDLNLFLNCSYTLRCVFFHCRSNSWSGNQGDLTGWIRGLNRWFIRGCNTARYRYLGRIVLVYVGKEQSPGVLLGCRSLFSPNQRYRASIIGKKNANNKRNRSSLSLDKALAMSHMEWLVHPCSKQIVFLLLLRIVGNKTLHQLERHWPVPTLQKCERRN